ncbi:MAG: Ni/Fe hydrogenase subunit alpha [Thermoprotei archaeon]
MSCSFQLTRVEGEGRVELRVENNRVVDAIVAIPEAPRFFEHIVIGKPAEIVVDIVSRICGLCGSSYSFAAARAFEKCFKIEVPEEIEVLREAIHLAERVKSHAIHVFLLEFPDYIGVSSILEANTLYSGILERILKIISWSRKAMKILGGRFHNVVNITIGGVFSLPRKTDVQELAKTAKELIRDVEYLADTVLSLDIPVENQELGELLTVYNGKEYPHLADHIYAYNSKEYIELEKFEEYITVEQVPWSNALHYKLANGKNYVVGPIARFNTAFNHLRGETRDLLKSYGYLLPLTSIEQSIIARIAELYDALLRLYDILEQYRESRYSVSRVEYRARNGLCIAAVEAPRGILYHRYRVDDKGRVLECNLITPTTQNLASMEDLIKKVAIGRIFEAGIKKKAERIVRSFDPCISCSVHIVRLDNF